MINYKLLLFVFISNSFLGFTQQIDTDKLYIQALQEYREGKYEEALLLTKAGIEVAPGYHDIRILQVQTLFALQKFQEAGNDIDFLLSSAPDYEGVKNLAIQRLSQLRGNDALDYNNRLLKIYGPDPDLSILKAKLLMQSGKNNEAREMAINIYTSRNFDDRQRYALQQIISQTVTNSVQITGQYINLSDNYSRNDPWYVFSTEYQHKFRNLALIGRATYSDRSYNDGSLYEIEAYPIFSEKLYVFGNLGFSSGNIFPDLRLSASVFYNFAPSFEAELGFRSLTYDENNYLSGIAGVTTYTGRFYLNARAFIGPERREKLVQNYQFNVRYYLSTPENYIFARLGSGISPDDPTLYIRAQENPILKALYVNAGINIALGIHHVVSISGGVLQEDLSKEKKGQQFTAGLSYRYKF